MLDLSHAPGSRNELADLDFASGAAAASKDGASDSDRFTVLNVAYSHLVSLACVPATPLHEMLQHVTTLQAPYNELRSLGGIEAFASLEVLNLSHNSISVVDAGMAALLHRLRFLRVVDLSYNRLQLLTLDAGTARTVATASNILPTSGAAATERPAIPIMSLNLSHNAIAELPDLRALPALQALNLDYNHLEDLTDLDSKLPLVALHTLQLRHNRLPSVSSTVPLAALANTIRNLQIYGNPFSLVLADEEEVLMSAQPSVMNRATFPGTSDRSSMLPTGRQSGAGGPWWWRPCLLWLLPLLQTLDTAELSSSERQAAVALFRERGALSKGLLELLNANRRDDLDAYLRKHSEYVVPPSDLRYIVQAAEEEDKEEAADGEQGFVPRQSLDPLSTREWTPAPETAGTTSPQQPPVSSAPSGRPAGATANASRAASISAQSATAAPLARADGAHSRSSVHSAATTAAPMSTVVRAMQQKLRTLAGVVETLWQHEVARRVFAAVVIQRHWRGYRCRAELPQETYESTMFARRHLERHAVTYSFLSLTPARSRRQPYSTSEEDHISQRRARSSSEGMAAVTTPVVSTGNQTTDIQEILNTMRGLQSVMTTMWEDLDEYRAMCDREERRAATTIQRHYRGYRGRKQWRQLKSGYDEFVDSLVPYVRVLQRIGRGYLVRDRLRVDADRRREVRRLRGEVDELREELLMIKRYIGMDRDLSASSPAMEPDTASATKGGRSPNTTGAGASLPLQASQLRRLTTFSETEKVVMFRPSAVDRSESATMSMINDDTRLEDDEDAVRGGVREPSRLSGGFSPAQTNPPKRSVVTRSTAAGRPAGTTPPPRTQTAGKEVNLGGTSAFVDEGSEEEDGVASTDSALAVQGLQPQPHRILKKKPNANEGNRS